MNKSLSIIIVFILIVSGILWYTTQQKKSVTQPTDIIIVGTNAEFPPFTFKKDDTIVGFDIDVINEVVNRMGKKIVIKDVPFEVLLPELQLDEIQIIAAGLTPTPERAKRVLFTKPHITSDSLAIISLATNPPINDIHDLHGKNVVVNEGYTADTYISHYQGPINLTRLSSASVMDGILSLKTGSAHAFISALYPLKPYFDKIGKKDFHIVPIKDAQESSAFAISKFQPELRDYMQLILDTMEKDGTLTNLKKKWGFA